jgi:hypothetical protein
LNFKRISLILTLILGLIVLYSGFKLLNFNLFPWLNVFISSTLSLVVFNLSFLIKGKSKPIQLLIFTFFIIQVVLNYSILQNADLLKINWRWLFYPISIFVFILAISAALRKQNKFILLSALICSLLFFICSIFSNYYFWMPLQMICFVFFSIGMIFSKNIQKIKAFESN